MTLTQAIAAGKVLLAYRQPRRDSVLDRGFAFDDGEFDDEIQSIAVPVADRSGNVLIAIGVTDTRRVNLAKHLALIRAAALRLRDSCDR